MKHLTFVTRQNNEINDISPTLFRPPRSKSHTFHSESRHEIGSCLHTAIPARITLYVTSCLVWKHTTFHDIVPANWLITRPV